MAAHVCSLAEVSVAEAFVQGEVDVGAVFNGGAANAGFTVLVGGEDIEEFFLVGFRFVFDFGEGAVGGPEVIVAAIWVKRFGVRGGFCF